MKHRFVLSDQKTACHFSLSVERARASNGVEWVGYFPEMTFLAWAVSRVVRESFGASHG